MIPMAASRPSGSFANRGSATSSPPKDTAPAVAPVVAERRQRRLHIPRHDHEIAKHDRSGAGTTRHGASEAHRRAATRR